MELALSEEGRGLITDFGYLEHTGFADRGLMARFRIFAVGRWTAGSLYTLYKEGLDAGNLEIALNMVGLMGDDLTPVERAAANRVYLMARARTLAIIKGQLSNSASSAKEAELLLKTMYGINDAEGGVMGGKFSINIQQVAGSGGQVAGTDKKVAVLDPDNIEVEFEDDDEAQEEA